MKLAIIIPAYNAAKTIEWVFERIPHEVREQVLHYVVVNDGSTDDTASVLERLQQRFAKLTVIDHGRNKGYGAAEKTLLKFAAGTAADVVVLLHSDGQYAPEAIPRLLAPFATEGADIVQGSRMMDGGAMSGGMPLYKFIANRALSAVQNVVFGLRLAEYHSGFMLYARRILSEIPFESLTNTFCYDQEMLVMAKVKGFKVVQKPIPTHYGDEISHLRPIRYGLRVLSLMWAYSQGYYHNLAARQVVSPNR